MNEGKFTPKNQDELLLLKRGELQVTQNKAMAHGNRYEAEAREWAEDELDCILEPMSIEREIDGLSFWSSLDGISMEGDISVEIKCPMAGYKSELWVGTVVKSGPPGYYYWQMLHQYITCPDARHFFIVYDAKSKRGLIRRFVPDADDINRLKDGWREFWQRYHSGETPEPKYVDMEDNAAWKAAAQRYREARARLVAAREEENRRKEELLSLARENSAAGHGVKAIRYFRAGNVDYRKIPELARVDLNDYRKDGSWCWRIDEE